MKKQITILSLAAVSWILFNAYTNGAPSSGATGSNGDNNKTCAQSGCHSGTATTVNNMISSDVPATGWEAGKTYNVSFSISEAAVSKFGFQVTSEDGSGNKKGTFVKTAATQILNGGSHITHLHTSTSGTGTKTWAFTWTAPSAGSGDITFYGAGNASDNRGTTTGDVIKKSSLTVKENTSTTGIALHKEGPNVLIYPNPVESQLSINGRVSGEFKIFDLSGLTRISGTLENGTNRVDVSELDEGIYFLYSEQSGLLTRIVKQ